MPADLRDKVHGWWTEFEAGETPEARYARALDRLQAFAQNVMSGGKSWAEHGVTRTRTFSRMQEALDSDPTLRLLVERLYGHADREGSWVPEPNQA